ncbi:MAG: hypothetical protein ABIO63_03060 [Casimicrobiaceae bacterium]
MLLGEHEWARAKLAPFSSRVIAVTVGPLHDRWTVAEDGTLAPATADVAADLELTISPLSVPALLAEPARWNQLVVETGDAQLGGVLKELAQTAPWLVEALLADALGPIVGQRAANLGRDLLKFPGYASERFTDSAVSYARDEAQLLARPDDMRRFTATVEEVATRVDALAGRVAALAARTGR